MKNKIDYKEPLELFTEYAQANNKILIYEYKDFYCQNTQYDNWGFFDCENFEELCDIVYEYLKFHKYLKLPIEIESDFSIDFMEFRVDDDFFVGIINCKNNTEMSFLGNEDTFKKYIKNKKISK